MNYAFFSTGKTNGEVWQKFITQDFFDNAPEEKKIEYNYIDPVSGEVEDRRVKLDETGQKIHTTRFCDFHLHPTLDKVIFGISAEVLQYTDAAYQSSYGFTVIDVEEAESEGFIVQV